MTTTVKQIMTPERFAQGMTWSQYVDSIKANKERFLQFYSDFKVKPEEVAFFKKFDAKKGPIKVVVIGEDWCPDVVRGIPVAVRLAEAVGMDLRIFPRDQNMDLMNEYLWRHEYLSIPVFAFFDKDWKELGHWIERPASGYKFAADLTEELSESNLSDEDKTKLIRERRAGVQLAWMHDTVQEIREYIFYRVL
ncbi:MAG TPA: thioredoxin family protein [Dehalococcoidia bacterium]|nr:thioredoxin family protein [Dehalococcoidia bacterium]